MASKRTRRKIEKQVRKQAKKRPVLFMAALLLVVVVVGVCVLHRKRVIHIPFLDPIIPQEQPTQSIITDELQIHFLQLGNKAPGDCTLIKTGNTEVLIDAGSVESSAGTLVPYINQYCTDGVLEYVIVTHADADHISAFVGTKSVDGIFESFVCETIIDFPKTTKNTVLYQNYCQLRDAEVEAGAKHYTALECWNNRNGAKRTYALADGITMNILYQKYYEESTSTENNNSVCTLFSQGNNHYLFTGDLEKAGEKSLVASNNLPVCKVYKAGHHGSDTSSTVELLEKIRPEIVVANCCCGGKYDFPHQEFIDNVAPYTDRVYIPVIASENADGYELLNGNIVVGSSGGELKVNCSNNATLLKDTPWFKANRTTPSAWAS
jgi:beta-lactamase superfamily II metal-dependent hydrolase